jgi:YidC/Oxa1 family membrane protein insertase
MFKFIASAFGYILNFIYNLVNNYGLAIIIFTVLLKLIMLPLTIKQQKTMKKTTEMQAKVKEIQNKYSNDQLRMSQELTDLYKRENVSPFSGCLTSLVQFFVILSIFYLVSSPLTYMKHVDQEIITKYTKEVREELGPENVRYPEIAIIKVKAKEDEKIGGKDK